MTKSLQNKMILAVLGLYVVVAILCLVFADQAIVSLLESIRTISLSTEADVGLTTIDLEIANLNREIDRLQADVSILEGRTYPTMQDLKQLQNKHRLSLLQMERVSAPGVNLSELLNYNTAMTGTVGGVVRFLQELESVHIVRSDQVRLRPTTENGSAVTLSISLLVRNE